MKYNYKNCKGENNFVYRNPKIENNVLEFFRSLPPHLIKFPFDIYGAIKTRSNFSVHSYQKYAKKHNLTMQDVVAFCESNTGCIFKQGKKYMILYNNGEFIVLERKLFTLTHEVGHSVAEHFRFISGDRIAEQPDESITDELRREIEREANHFAANVLCPLPYLYMTSPSSPKDIQTAHRLSEEAAEIAYRDYRAYERSYNMKWHNAMLRILTGVDKPEPNPKRIYMFS
jgi:Zn-dependent peptidase ImmA (M78 family)